MSHQTFKMLKKEFSFENIKLNYKRANDFVESKWFPVPVVFAYRSLLALVCSTWIVYAAVTSTTQVKRYFYLTRWTYASITIYFILSAILTALHFTRESKSPQHQRLLNEPDLEAEDDSNERKDDEVCDVEGGMKWYHRINWVLLNISCNMSLCVTIAYWTLVYDGGTIHTSDIFVHILNSVFMVVEVVLSSVPIRLLHLVYPFMFGLVYTLMTVIFWLFIDQTPVYSVLDYSNKPGLAAGVLVGSHLLLLPLVQTFLYTIYRVRNYLADKYSKNSN